VIFAVHQQQHCATADPRSAPFGFSGGCSWPLPAGGPSGLAARSSGASWIVGFQERQQQTTKSTKLTKNAQRQACRFSLPRRAKPALAFRWLQDFAGLLGEMLDGRVKSRGCSYKWPDQ